ncbi:MAG: hypothetical protein KatS3mg076_3120 [Candidatus Binatia bacterium]|nr:MAG: hypothetical protein KatS3mg076_3120 [Candidatus Binatia bacterium]
MRKLPTLAVIASVPFFASLAAAEPRWNPEEFADESTIELRTITPAGEPHWFPVWVVVLDGEPYVRLGNRAARRIRENRTAPYVAVRVAGKVFERVRGVEAPEKAEAVAKAMGEKYWSDIVVRLFPHPLTLRLVPE